MTINPDDLYPETVYQLWQLYPLSYLSELFGIDNEILHAKLEEARRDDYVSPGKLLLQEALAARIAVIPRDQINGGVIVYYRQTHSWKELSQIWGVPMETLIKRARKVTNPESVQRDVERKKQCRREKHYDQCKERQLQES